MIFVDTNILIDIASADPQWMDWSIDALTHASRRGPLVINAIVYSEFSLGFASEAACDAEIERIGLRYLDLPKSAAFSAAIAFREYRKKGGARTSALPDFFIGAHASALRSPAADARCGTVSDVFSRGGGADGGLRPTEPS